MIVAAKVKLYLTAKRRALLEKHFGSGRFDPSSKLCSRCDNIRHGLKPSDRAYRCDECRLAIDRYYNASKNIRGMGLIKVGPVRPEFTPVETPTAGHQTGQSGQAVASRVSLNQETSSRVADEPILGDSNAGSSRASA